MTMKLPPIQEEHYGEKVWVNPTTEAIRKEECFCHNCANLKPDKPSDSCPKAEDLYQVLKRHNLAVITTRCGEWKPKQE